MLTILLTTLLPVASALGGQQCLSFDSADHDSHLVLADHGTLVPIITDSSDAEALHVAVSTFADDIERVTGSRPAVYNNTVPDWANKVVMVGTTSSPLLSGIAGTGSSDLQGKWEAYDMRVVQQPVNGVAEALIITGSDKRGAIYGMYELSEQMGVSPWYWWADVPVSHHDVVAFPKDLVCDHGAPTVKYRGLFINDENPVLSSWSHEYFGIPKSEPPFQVGMYEKMFELLLRLKGNYFWPAMWASMFDVDGLDVSGGLPDEPTAGPNQILADKMGIVMGTSHQEPMARNTPEWSSYGEGEWNFTANTDVLHDFWVYGAERAKGYETMFTVGMRGNGDLPLPGANVPIMENITAVQQDILRMVYETEDISSIPQVWAMYKEVMGYFADGMAVPDDVIELLAEDNWGNLVAVLPWGDNHTAGGGIYYHADYVGDPRSYKWINTVPLAKMWEQMDIARQFQTTELWILNVGDLKMLEIPIEWYLSLAYDSDRWPRNSMASHLSLKAKRDFGLSEDDSWEVAEIMGHYQMMVSRRKPEQIDSGTFSIENYDEANQIVKQWKDLEYRSKCVYEKLSGDAQTAFFELVHAPVALNANLNELYVSAGKSNLYATQALSSANLHAEKARECFDRDWELTHEFHTLLDGKWNHMLAQTHINYQYWQQPMRNSMPQVSFITPHDASYPNEIAYMRVTAEGYKGAWPGDNEFNCPLGYNCPEPIMQPMDPHGRARYFEVGSGGPMDINFTATSNESWVTVSPSEGWIKGDGSTDTRCWINIDWDNVPADLVSGTGMISVNGSDGSVVTVTVPVNNTQRPPDDWHGFVEGDGYVVMEAGHFTQNATVDLDGQTYSWEEIDYYGRTYSGMAVYPIGPQNFTAGQGPKLSYDFWATDSMANNTVNVTMQIGPSLNFMLGSFLSFGVSLDDQEALSINPVPWAPLGSQPTDWEWVVANEVRNVTMTLDLGSSGPGQHTLNVWGMTIGVVLERIWIDMGGIAARGYSYIGPPESMRV